MLNKKKLLRKKPSLNLKPTKQQAKKLKNNKTKNKITKELKPNTLLTLIKKHFKKFKKKSLRRFKTKKRTIYKTERKLKTKKKTKKKVVKNPMKDFNKRRNFFVKLKIYFQFSF